MNLVLDIGNTSVKAALFKHGKLIQLLQSTSEVKQVVEVEKISHCIISKTGSDHPLEDFLGGQNFRVRHFSSAIKLPFSNHYGSPETVGTDRLALVAGALQIFPGQNLLCIDTGTCITYNFINNKAEFLGGSISPGLEMRFKALHHFTARLPLVKWKIEEHETEIRGKKSEVRRRKLEVKTRKTEAGREPRSDRNSKSVDIELAAKLIRHYHSPLIGETTESSILSGVLNGLAAEADGIINQYKKRYRGLKVVVTGGSLPFFGSALENAIFARPNLVLHGLNAILEYNS